MQAVPEIIVLGGGVSAERTVSLASAQAVHASLAKRYPARWIDVVAEALPEQLDPARHVVCPILHGTFGEDGGIQRLLEAEGFAFTGSDARSSALCMDKRGPKELAAGLGIATPPALYFQAESIPSSEAIEAALGTLYVVVKPRREGSSVGLRFADSAESLDAVFETLSPGEWMIEPRLRGHDLTVGVLDGEALAVVEILPKNGGAYDYANKYTPGATEYRYPAKLPPAQIEALRKAAAALFNACGCRDFARIDFFNTDNGFAFLEINTIPGFTATSLLPMSAACVGYDFDRLTDAMLAPALRRFQALPVT